MQKTRLQAIIDIAKASIEVTIELECFVAPEKCFGLRDFSMLDLQSYMHPNKPIEDRKDFVHGVVPMDWLFCS